MKILINNYFYNRYNKSGRSKCIKNRNPCMMYLANLHTSFLCNLIYPTFITLSVYIN